MEKQYGFGTIDDIRNDSFPGHEGRPGKRGGSLPKNERGYGNQYSKRQLRQTKTFDGKPNSLSKHVVNGKLTKEREALHKEIIDKFFAGKRPAEGQPVMTFMGGGPAAGKGSVEHGLKGVYPNKEDTIIIDSDEIKKMLPEYQKMSKEKDPEAANFVHTESSMLSYRILNIAQKNGYNTLLDGTGDRSVKDMTDSIQFARKRGMKVNGIYCTCSMENAIERADNRAAETGRYIPRNVLINTHKGVSEVLPKVAWQFDSVSLYDTNGGREVPPKLVATGGSGHDLKVHDADAYREFLNKANYSK